MKRTSDPILALSPYILGEKPIFGNMPDWNPAEIVGTKPRPLALSLYQCLITNEIWAKQRHEYGYRDVRPCPLITSFSGHPYVDVRASLNSFIPAGLSEEVSLKLVRAYTDLLLDNPEWDDKIEFKIAFTIWCPGFRDEATNRFKGSEVTPSDILQLEGELKTIARGALTRLERDTHSISEMSERQESILASNMEPLDKAIALIDDCRRFGTLAFAHAARAGFVASAFLNGFVAQNVISEFRREEFLRSLKTVAGEFTDDKARFARGELDEKEITKRYGHLRPGTYDINAKAYWEEPKRFSGSEFILDEDVCAFELTEVESRGVKATLQELGASSSPMELFSYLASAIKARESVKFEFTKNLSAVLDACVHISESLGMDRASGAYLHCDDLMQLKLNSLSRSEVSERVARRKRDYLITQMIELPRLITKTGDLYGHERHSSQPNFVTLNCVVSEVAVLNQLEEQEMEGKIVLIPQADPDMIGFLVREFAG